MKHTPRGVYVLLLFLLTGCGYRWQPDTLPTVSVPLISGDEEGALTSEIIRALHSSGLVEWSGKGADYRLVVSIQGSDVKTVGFRRDIEVIKGSPKENLIASESRKAMTIEVSFYKGKSEQIAYGPYVLSAEADFDYVMGDSLQDLTFSTPENPQVVVLPFSLGQLESNESAQEAATKPLYARLAQKIVDVIAAEW